MILRPGMKLFSTVSQTQVVVVKAPADDVAVECGGAPMVEEEPTEARADAEGPAEEAALLGKRYADGDIGLEVLCTRPGSGGLAVDGRPLALKGAKPLPSSD